MTERAQARIWDGIDIPKTIAGTLAAVSAAVIGSFLGVAGTLAGAALVSLISSVGTEIYRHFVHHGTRKLQAAFVTAPAAIGTPEVAAAPAAPADAPAGPSRRIHWKRILLVAGALFLLALGTLTTAELLAGRSAADATSGRDSGAPTVFHWSGRHTTDKKQAPAPSPSTTATGSDQTAKPAGTTAPADSGPGPTATTKAPQPEQTGGTGSTPGSDTATAGTGDGAGADTQQNSEQHSDQQGD
ncbi:hypothetical protein ACWT_6720 [Actinoplanes sp. SE50]|uniref:hypothetical protein n=1 Tax=unclassified Actinoplanes TaxID=2626549 RepID=UPI00023ECD8A|nr:MULTISPECIES: hypothetical protein [unclassified Actinoplanes]AEV87733.1 hypothetical protein ACPL_6851 [Actinoplanes sp. SE50/110]ATO86135.1 hypothetical protein ACWT_6720 [Actinoplanes sp. SE50]SLM03549.1 hypothetical protein ACSP50_6842 [Actinoplanes sp. SE50/110]